MTLDDVEAKLLKIKEVAEEEYDDEVAHCLEKDLMLKYIQYRAELGDMVAGKILESKEIKFCRWFV